jgi:RimJ/RimL family protein N-acetyltransferase
VTVREARSDDVEAAVRAYESSWDAALAPLLGRRLDDLVPFDERVASFHQGLGKTSADAKVWVAELDGEIVGVAVYARADAETGELRALYVVPEAWGTGAAQELMSTALAAMRAGGQRQAILWVVEENARARRFYEREGWSPDGVTRETPLGPSEARYGLALS